MLATLPEYPRFSESIAYQLSGLLVVFVALGGLWALLEVIGACFRCADRKVGTVLVEPPASAPPPPVDAPVMAPLTCALISATVHAASQGRARILSATPEAPPVTYAIIAAAVHCMFEGRVRIVSVSPVHSDPSWAREGRRDIFSSHRIR
jgi:hypothetical protein